MNPHDGNFFRHVVELIGYFVLVVCFFRLVDLATSKESGLPELARFGLALVALMIVLPMVLVGIGGLSRELRGKNGRK